MSNSTRLFVGNLPENFKEDALREIFSSFGQITNIDIKTKPGTETETKIFAFVSLSASNFNIESCIKHFSKEYFCGHRLHVTRARESFLERLQREREQSKQGNVEKCVDNDIYNEKRLQREKEHLQKGKVEKCDNEKRWQKEREQSQKNYNNEYNNIQKIDGEKFKIHKRKFHDSDGVENSNTKNIKVSHKNYTTDYNKDPYVSNVTNVDKNDDKKLNSDMKRIESIKRKRQEFNEKKNIIKTGFISIDKQINKKVIFSDAEEDDQNFTNISNYIDHDNIKQTNHKINLFEDNTSEDETNFEMKKQFEGKKGQKVLELQSKYKTDKRFTLDERFIEDDQSENEEDGHRDNETVELGQVNEKSKQLNILQDVLGVTIKTNNSDLKNKTSKQGMFRFDPSHPDHAKFLAPAEARPESTKKAKNKKNKDTQEEKIPVIEKVEVSKEQFYEISDTLKEAITKPEAFSLRSLFNNENVDKELVEQKEDHIQIGNKKDKKVRNPLDPGEKNPFIYDSSESENEEDVEKVNNHVLVNTEPKVVWRENLFFGQDDKRLEEGLLFFTQMNNTENHKDRRELKSLMKKRIYNKERKNQMFKKKIGGRKKTMKKLFRNKS